MRVLCSTGVTNDLGLPSRLLPVAAELRRRGHDVAFANPATAASALIESAGFANLAWPTPQDPLGPRASTIPVEFPLVDAEQSLCLIYGDPDYTRTEVENWRALLDDWKADVLLDTFAPAGCAAALINGVPLVEVLQADFHPEAVFNWWEPRRPQPTAAGHFNTLLSAAGVPEVDLVTRLPLRGKVAVVGSPSTDPVPGAPLPYVGSLQWGSASDELPASVPTHGRRPLVVLYGGNPDYLGVSKTGVVGGAAIEALAEEDIDVVLAAGNQEYPDVLPSNFVAVRYASGPALLKIADAMIHHGGHGSYLLALAAGKPAVSIPTYAERESNARRMADLGAGICLVPGGDMFTGQSVDSSALRAAVREVLDDPRYASAAQKVGAELNALPGAAGVADMVEAAARQV